MDVMQDNKTYLKVDVEAEITEAALKEEKKKIGNIADKAKFITTTGAHYGTVACVGMRPGTANAQQER